MEGPVLQVLVCKRVKTYSSDELGELLHQAGGGSVSFMCLDEPAKENWSPGGVWAPAMMEHLVGRMFTQLPEVRSGEHFDVVAHWEGIDLQTSYEGLVGESGGVAALRALEVVPVETGRLRINVRMPLEAI